VPSLRIKICGITRPQDAQLAASAGADFLGLNFYPPSPRYISAANARQILADLPASARPVALFVQLRWKDAIAAAHALNIPTLQMHGDLRETPPPAIAFLPAFPVKDAASLTRIREQLSVWHDAGISPLAILVDAHVPGLHGGTGTTAPWDLLADFDPGIPLVLAGGLTPENVGEAVRKVRPWGVDVASGVESSPGVKDAEKVRRFIENAKEALS